MPTSKSCFTLAAVVIMGFLLAAGCQPAGRYGPAATKAKATEVAKTEVAKTKLPDTKKETKAAEPMPPPPHYAWDVPATGFIAPEVKLVFVHQGTNPKEWDKLKDYMTYDPPLTPATPAAMFGVPGLVAAALNATAPQRVVKVKVPLGLDDPTSHIPAWNHPNMAKWELGKRLFFDDNGFLYPPGLNKESCATCHNPKEGFTQRLPAMINPPTIINTLYNTYEFWDGRANELEEVIQRTLAEESEKSGKERERHSWPGIVTRLQKNNSYRPRFQEAFGTEPTQDAVGKALATYMRTVLVGGSIQDKAEQAQKARGSKVLEPKDYVKALDKETIKTLLEPDPEKPAEEAAKLFHQGYTLFHGKAGCAQCHKGGNYTDNGFHNLGLGNSRKQLMPGQEMGRFKAQPPGMKDLRMMGAYKTPTLRALPRTPPYFHDGSQHGLDGAIRWHIKDAPEMKGAYHDDPDLKSVDLNSDEVRALVLFLKALDGEPIPAVVAEPGKKPE